jgi:hypothetical protein
MNIKRAGTRLRVSFALAAVLALTIAVPASAGARDKVGMIDFETGDAVAGHISIDRGNHSVDANMHLRGLNPGHAFTVWAVVFNSPLECTNAACGEDDLPTKDKPGTGDPAVIFSGVGGVANGGGNLNGSSTIGEGEDGAPGQRLLSSLKDAEFAEIHFVVQDHGEAFDDVDELLSQTTMFEYGCGDGSPPTPPNPKAHDDDTCLDVQAAIFQP